ncbi:MAG: Queuine tRNA-ribosyltransferase [Microgenomates bacterium OLB23]|nr:MAG: Queuine tRNA-ribosyltransferase [Microgenomates bacterium OLB23]
MKEFVFDVLHKSSMSRARRGKIVTPHGVVETPAFVTVGTKGTVKALAPEDLEKTGTQFVFANTYHLVLSPGAEMVHKLGGVHSMSGISKPMITDSGGFQAFSLAFPDRKNMYELLPQHDDGSAEEMKRKPMAKITDDGVEFTSHIDGKKYLFTPESSIQAQQHIGADFVVAFDECIYNGATKEYTKRSTERTHEWALRSLATLAGPGLKKVVPGRQQQMYGVIQGGKFKDLREMSTNFIAAQAFFGIALGGVSVGETNAELRDEITWMMDVLHQDARPRHLLGISTLDDVLFSVKHGVDTFDCILPTRDARIGRLYIHTPGTQQDPLKGYEAIDILKSSFKTNTEPINPHILGSVTYAYLHHLFKQRELLAYRLASMNNLYMIEQFFAEIRKAIEEDRL